MKLLLVAGHGEGDGGAVGSGYVEADLTRELVSILSRKFGEGDVEVTVYDTEKNLYKQIQKGNVPDFRPYQYVLEVHFNASVTPDTKGDGVIKGSMFYISQSETGHTVEDLILENLYGIGSRQAWDGVVVAQRQWEKGLLVQETCRAQGVSHGLLETCFISDKDDMEWYQANKEQIAQMIADGIIDGFKVRRKPEPEPVPTVFYRVQIGAYTVEKNARTQLKRAQEAGFTDAFILYSDGYYRVQIGAYEKEENAKHAAERARAAGFDVFIRRV